MAYLIAGWGRTKKMPDLNKMLESTNQRPKDQTDEQLFKTIRQINAAMGGKEVKREVSE
ncbi:hypothetical protein D3C78_1770180 [compost metagenome]